MKKPTQKEIEAYRKFLRRKIWISSFWAFTNAGLMLWVSSKGGPTWVFFAYTFIIWLMWNDAMSHYKKLKAFANYEIFMNMQTTEEHLASTRGRGYKEK